jgi:hypothetical protein
MRMKTAVAMLLSALGAGCAGSLDVSYVRTGPPLEPKPEEYAMPVYYNQEPSRPYREVAQIRVRSTRADATLDKVVGAAAEDARELGADAIIVDARRGYHSVQLGVDCDGRPYAPPEHRLNARVTAIVFTRGPQEASPERPPAGPTPIDTCPTAKGRL